MRTWRGRGWSGGGGLAISRGNGRENTSKLNGSILPKRIAIICYNRECLGCNFKLLSNMGDSSDYIYSFFVQTCERVRLTM